LSEPKIVIIGAGPTGLGAGHRLNELGHRNFRLYERAPHLGGLAASFTDSAGFTWDIGGHVMFSHYAHYDRVFDELMGDEFQLNTRESWVRIAGTWVPYPFQNNIRYLPPSLRFECLRGLIHAQHRRDHRGTRDFESFVEAVFGDGICDHFMKPYNWKVWAHPPRMLAKEWIGERVATIDVDRALGNVVLEQDDFGWGPNNRFKFPLRGGTGEFYRRFERPLRGHVTLGKTAASVDLARKRVRFTDGEVESYDALISTLPLDRLCNEVIGPGMPDRLRQAAARLRHSGGHMVGVGLRQPCPSTRSWMYFPESNCPFYRVTYLSNYSPFMAPDANHYSLLCETSYSEFKPVAARDVVDDTIRGLVASGLIAERDQDDIVDVWTYDAPYSYPTPSLERDAILDAVLPWLESHGIYSRGRFGAWKYEVSNTDHSLMQGVEVVDRLLRGEPETTLCTVYASIAADRAGPRRSAVAGSGDPGRAALRGAARPQVVRPDSDVAEEELGVASASRSRSG
jgi:UDP-galactopyranose mutase